MFGTRPGTYMISGCKETGSAIVVFIRVTNSIIGHILYFYRKVSTQFHLCQGLRRMKPDIKRAIISKGIKFEPTRTPILREV